MITEADVMYGGGGKSGTERRVAWSRECLSPQMVELGEDHIGSCKMSAFLHECINRYDRGRWTRRRRRRRTVYGQRQCGILVRMSTSTFLGRIGRAMSEELNS